MPLYEYRCRNCGTEFECLMLNSDPVQPECPCCHKTEIDKLISAGSIRPQGIPAGSGGFSPPACAPRGG